MLLKHGLAGLASAPATSVVLPTYVTVADSGASAAETSKTFTSVSLGTADTNRVIVLGFWVFDNSNTSGDIFSSVTVAGITATKIAVSTFFNYQRLGWYRVTVPTGSTGNIVINFSTTVEDACVFVYRGVGLTTFTAGTFDENGTAGLRTSTVATTTGGAVIAMRGGNNVNSGGTWTGATLDAEIDVRTNEYGACASSTTTINETRSITHSDAQLLGSLFVK